MRRNAELAEIGVARSLVEAALEIIDGFQLRGLRGDKAEHDALITLRQQSQGLETARPLGVVFHEVDIDACLIEDRVGGRVVRAVGGPGGLVVAATQVHRYDEVVGTTVDGVVHHPRVLPDEPVRVDTLRLLLGPMLRVAQIGEEDVVHLKIPAAGLVEGVHRLAIGPRYVGEEHVEIGIFGRMNVAQRSPEVTRTRARYRDLGQHGRDRDQVAEVAEHRVVVRKVDLPRDRREDRAEREPVKLDAHVAFLQLQAAQSAHEVVVPERAPVFAVGDRLQAHSLLHPDRVPDRLVFDGPQLAAGVEPVRSEAVRTVADPGFVHAFGAEEAPDMVGPKRWGGWHDDFL